MDHDQIELKSVELYDPIQKRQYCVLVAENSEVINEKSDNEDAEYSEQLELEDSQVQATIWNQNETLALINIYSLHKEKFCKFKKKKNRWSLVSRELSKIGIDKAPKKCEIKWRNLLRSYRIYKNSNKEQGKFEFFNELDNILSNDPQFKQLVTGEPNGHSTSMKLENDISLSEHSTSKSHYQSTKKKCSCTKTDKQKRHEDKMALLRKKVEVEERKVYYHSLRQDNLSNWIDDVEEMKIPEQTYEYKEFVRKFDKVCKFKYHKFYMIDNNYDTYYYQYLKNALIHKAKKGNDEESKTKLENIRGQELLWRKQRLYMALSWIIDVIEGKTMNYRLNLKHILGNFKKVPHIQGYEKPGRRAESYPKYHKYVAEKLGDKDKGSKSNTNSDIPTPKKEAPLGRKEWEVENTTEQQDVIERKKDNEVQEPENRPSKEASPPLEQLEDEYFVHLSNAESDDELDNQQKSEQFMNTEKILKEIAEERKPTMISTPEQEKGDKKPIVNSTEPETQNKPSSKDYCEQHRVFLNPQTATVPSTPNLT
ncbi:hypothetical protein JTB14_028309 [Gonioctena quinquepunctata]|nr:hypothetical protein JTB14_028309 [Gonioctena quinquepunctata]